MNRIFVAGCVPLAGSSVGLAQSESGARVFSKASLESQIQTLIGQSKAAGSSGQTLFDDGSHKLQISVRTASGAAEVHAHYDDVMIVQQGSATLVTGGTVVDANTSADGETHGTSISNGRQQPVSAGDVISIKAGVPHQLIVPQGTIYSALVIKVKEQPR